MIKGLEPRTGHGVPDVAGQRGMITSLVLLSTCFFNAPQVTIGLLWPPGHTDLQSCVICPVTGKPAVL